MTAVREARPDDVPSVATALARAFDDDPVMTYLIPKVDKRPKGMKTFFRHDLRRAFAKGAAFTTDSPESRGGAIWFAPKQWKAGGLELFGQLPIAFAFGRHVPRALSLLNRVEKAHLTDAKEEHWYLAVLGTDPRHQGAGVGSALVQPILDRCDSEGIGAYLESSKEANIPFYRRHGFEVTSTIDIDGGPSLWPMWRDPR